MIMATRKGIFEEHLGAWLQAKGDKKRRGEIIRNICFIAKVHPKSVPRSFRRVQHRDPLQEETRGRPTVYTPDVTAALKQVWEAGGEVCGELLHPLIAGHVAAIAREGTWHHGDETTAKLLRMSEATVRERVARFMRTRPGTHGASTTKPGSIHAMVPIRSDGWAESPAGTLQVDTVAHCGATVAGDFVYTVNAADVATLWGARHAQWQKGQEATVESASAIAAEFPLPIREWHPDSGSEFVNWHLKGWCDARGELLTRSRPNHKNDNCFVEERNGHVVRRWVGYARLDVRETVDALNELYAVLTPFLNHFVASKRIIGKERVGARWRVTRERKAKTPYQRVLERDDVSDEAKGRLRAEHEVLRLLWLRREIDRRTERVFAIQKRYGSPMARGNFR